MKKVNLKMYISQEHNYFLSFGEITSPQTTKNKNKQFSNTRVNIGQGHRRWPYINNHDDVIRFTLVRLPLISKWTFKQARGSRTIPANKRHWANAGSMLGHRLRRWPNIDPALAQCLLLAGMLF